MEILRDYSGLNEYDIISLDSLLFCKANTFSQISSQVYKTDTLFFFRPSCLLITDLLFLCFLFCCFLFFILHCLTLLNCTGKKIVSLFYIFQLCLSFRFQMSMTFFPYSRWIFVLGELSVCCAVFLTKFIFSVEVSPITMSLQKIISIANEEYFQHGYMQLCIISVCVADTKSKAEVIYIILLDKFIKILFMQKILSKLQ